jgi:hypothetical protein
VPSSAVGDDIISLNILGSTAIVINSSKAISDIFDKRGSNYSDRPDMPMIVDLYAVTSLRFHLAFHTYKGWVGTGHSHSCVTVLIGRNIAAFSTPISIIALKNINRYKLKYQESF